MPAVVAPFVTGVNTGIAAAENVPAGIVMWYAPVPVFVTVTPVVPSSKVPASLTIAPMLLPLDDPAGPVGPVGPCGPVAPVAPGSPVAPVAPVTPGVPADPV